MKRLLTALFPRSLWTRATLWLWLCMALVFLWFDVEWCLATTFTSFSMPELWVNTLLLSLLLTTPQALGRLSRTQAWLTLAMAVWLECNLLYSRTYFNAIPLGSYTMVGNLQDFTASVLDSFRVADLGFLPIVAAAFAVGYRRRAADANTERPSALVWVAYLLILTAISGIMLAKRGGLTAAWRQLANANYFSCRVPMYTVVGSLANDALTASAPITSEERDATRQWLEYHSRFSANELDSLGRDNIVLILCESFESWPIGLTVQGKEITPYLNKLVADTATTFYAPHVVSQVGAGRSIDAQLLINAGMLPMLRGVYAMDRPNNTYHTLTQALEEQRGARSYLLTVDKASTWNQLAVARAFGIDSILARDSWVNDEKVGSRKKLGDRSFARQIVEKMRHGEVWPQGENAFVQIVTYSGHNPFILPENLDSLRLDRTKLPSTVANYLTMAHYTDGAIATLVDYIASRPDFARTLIVITGDHEGLASEREELARQCSFVSPRQEVPLIVVNAPRGGRYDGVMGQIDIHPTLLDMAGLHSAPWRGMGISVADSRFPGVAIGSQSDLQGDASTLSEDILQHIEHARQTSDRIITFNLLNNSSLIFE